MSISCMLEQDCNGNPISTFPPCYAFQMIFTALAPRLIQSISRNVHNKNGALKQLWQCSRVFYVICTVHTWDDQDGHYCDTAQTLVGLELPKTNNVGQYI